MSRVRSDRFAPLILIALAAPARTDEATASDELPTASAILRSLSLRDGDSARLPLGELRTRTRPRKRSLWEAFYRPYVTAMPPPRRREATRS